MAGENPEDQPTGGADEFLSKTKWQRFQILFMGPLMNLILAVVLTAVVLMQGARSRRTEDQPVVIGKVEAGSPAEQVGHPSPAIAIVKVAARTCRLGALRDGDRHARQSRRAR